MTQTRNNETWIQELQAGGTDRDVALEDLRAILRRVLPQGRSRSLSPQGPSFDALLEDAIQETLLRVLDRLETFELHSQFTTWVYKIAVRIALNELRRRRWQDVSLESLTATPTGEAGAALLARAGSRNPGGADRYP